MDQELHQLNRRIVAATSAADGAYYRWAVRSGVTHHTLDLLYALDDGQPHSQKQICEEWAIPKTTVNTVVRSCREAGVYHAGAYAGPAPAAAAVPHPGGMAYAREALAELYVLENQAMAAAVKKYGPSFVDALELYCASFQEALAANLSEKEENDSV